MSTDIVKGSARRDELLLDAWANGKTPEQISQSLNVTPEHAVLRVKQLLATRDALTEYEQKQLLMHSAYRFKEVMDSSIDLVAEDPKLANNYIRMIEMLSKLLDKIGEISQRELTAINDAQSRAIIGAVEKAFYAISKFLKAEHPEVNINRLNAEFRKAVQEGLVQSNDS